jgi:multicomponent Na+:H+ antiporter subunit G
MINLITGSLLVIGAFFILISGLGLLRFPDIYTRMHAVSKSMSLGIGSILLAAMIYFGNWNTTIKSLLIIHFLFVTIPVGSQLMSFTAFTMKIPFWENTVIDEYSNKPED